MTNPLTNKEAPIKKKTERPVDHKDTNHRELHYVLCKRERFLAALTALRPYLHVLGQSELAKFLCPACMIVSSVYV